MIAAGKDGLRGERQGLGDEQGDIRRVIPQPEDEKEDETEEREPL